MDIDCISKEVVDFQAEQVYVDVVANEPSKVHQVITVSENNNKIPCCSLTETQKEVISDCNDNFSSKFPQYKKKRLMSDTDSPFPVTVTGSSSELQNIMSTFKDQVVNELTTLFSKSTVKDNEVDKF